MRKHFLIAGMLLAAALVFAVPSKADTVDFSLSGGAITASFTLPDTLTPDFSIGSVQFVFNVAGTLFNDTNYTYGTIDFGNSGLGTWAFGSTGHTQNGHVFAGPELGIFVAGLFTTNADGTITFNSGTWTLTNLRGTQITLTTNVVPGGTAVPEPATLALLGAGGLAFAAFRRRKTA